MGDVQNLLIGYNLSTAATPDADPAADAAQVESLGFDFVSMSDHLHGTHPTFETWTMLTWVAAATDRVRLVTNVLGTPYRSPAVTAKMAESLHRLCGERLVLGLGAGGNDEEFAAFGLRPPSAGGKVEAFEEAVTAMRALWSQPDVTFEGRHHRLAGATITPRPRTPIPIWVGAYGPRMLRLVGELADGWLPSMPFVGPDRLPQLRDMVRRAADEAGRDPDELTYAYNVGVRIGRVVEGRPMLSGSIAQVADGIAQLTALGLDAINLWPAGDEEEQRPHLAELVRQLKGR